MNTETLPITISVVSRLMYLLDKGDSGLSSLSSSAMYVLTVMAMSTDPKTLEVWVPHKVLSRRTGLSLATVKRCLNSLGEYLQFVRFRENGILVYRLHLPGLEPVNENRPAPQVAEPFDLCNYVEKLTEPVAGIGPDTVRAVVKYHWENRDNDYWRRGDKHSVAWLTRHIGEMTKQYDRRESKQAATAGQQRVQSPAPKVEWVPLVYPRKGEKLNI